MLAPVLAAAMTLGDAVAFALDHSQTVSTQQAAVTLAQHNLALQRGVAYPTVNGSLQSWLSKSANYQGNYGVIGQTQQNVFSQNTAQVGIPNWNLTSGGFAFLTLAATRAQAQQAQNTLANTEDQIATSVTNSFYGIVQRKAIVVVDQAALDYQNALTNLAKLRVKAGVAAGVDVLQALTSAAKSESSLVADRAAVEDARESLAQQIGAPLQTQFEAPNLVPQPPLPHGSVDSLVGIAQAYRPDIAAAHEAVLAANYTRRGWNVELFPAVRSRRRSAISSRPRTPSFSRISFRRSASLGTCPPTVSASFRAARPGFGFCRRFPRSISRSIDYNARHSERVNDDAQLVSAKSVV